MSTTAVSGQLDALAHKHGTDKCGDWHAYTAIYERYLCTAPKPTRLLEIGVAGGASLLMWRDWLGEGCKVWGVDHNPAVLQLADPIRVILADASDSKTMQAIAQELRPHIVVDDGSHFQSDQRAAFLAIWPWVEPGGWYCIEDLHTAYWPNYGDIRPMLWDLVDQCNQHGRVEFAAKGPPAEIQSVNFHQSVVLVQKSPAC